MNPSSKLAAVVLLAMALAACASAEAGSGGAERGSPPSPDTPAAGPLLTGASIATMADQYARPRAGSVAASGASAWVGPPPPPAFVLSGPLPDATPPAPPPAAVANRQPAAPAADAVRPEAAVPEAPQPPAADAALRARGLALFNDWACGTCHALADAGAAGAIGPSLDGNPQMTRAAAIEVITRGRGAMPGFGGQMTDEEIAVLTDYIVRHARR